MFHSVPKVLCKNKEAAVFQKHWNDRVSPGEVMYGHSKSGKQMVSAIKDRAGAKVLHKSEERLPVINLSTLGNRCLGRVLR